MNTPKCPDCGSANTVFKQKAQQWECGDCESRFVDTQYDARPRRIFLSYPHAPDKHSQLVEDVAKVITAKGHHPWFDKNKIKEGYDWRESITQGVLDADWLIIFMSQKSLAAGGVCLEEVGIALQKSGHETLLTVLLEDEKTVNPPISLTHVQWLDVKDFEDAYPEDRNNPAAMQKWAQWLDERFTRLIRHIERKGDIQGDISTLRNHLQPASFVGQIAHSIKGFVGREWVFDEIQHWQHHHRERRTFVIEGAAGIGKSAIAGQLSQQLRDVIGIYFCKHNDATTRDANNLVRTMVFQIASRDPAYRSWLKTKLTEQEFEGNKLLVMNAPALFNKLIANAPRINEENKARLILVIDGLDEAKDETGKNAILDLVSEEFRKLPANIGVVITTRPEQEIVARLNSPYVLSTDDERNIGDIETYLDLQFDSLDVFKTHSGAKAQAKTSARKKSGGVMLYVSELVRSIRDGHIDPLVPESFPEGLSGIYLGFMKREFPLAETFHHTSAKLAELIAVSPLPLTEALMRAVTGLKRGEFTRYIKPLSSLLVTGERNDATTYALFHKSFADWLVKPSRLHDYQLEGNDLKRMGDFLYGCFLAQGQQVKFDSAEIEWGARELLPLCLPDMALWNDAEALEALGSAFYKRGWYRAAIVAQTQVLAVVKETLGEAHPKTLSSMASLASMLSRQGDLSGARALEEQALAERITILGDTHPNTLTSMANLAVTLHKQGDLAGARALQEQALVAKKATLGDEHPSTLFSMANLAGTLFTQGDSAGARALQEQALATRKATLGDKHPDTLNSMAYLALSLKAQGDLAGARALQEQALSANKAMLGDEHPDTLTSMANLASTLRAQGDLAGARALEEQVLATKKAILGIEHPSTLISMANLASILYEQGDLVGARRLYEQALAAQKAILGDAHPNTLTSMANLASTLQAQGDLAGARALQEQALEVLKATFGDKHPDTMTSMSNLSNILHAQGDLTGSRALQEQVLAAQKSKLGEAHPDTLLSMSNLAGTLRAQGDIDGARALQERVLAARKAMQGDEHPDTLRGMNNLANTLYAQGDLAGARALYEQALTAQRATLGNEHPSTLISMNNLAGTLYAQGDLAGARALLEQVLVAQKAMLGDKHPNTLTSMANLANTLYEQGDLAGAQAMQEQVLAAQKAMLGDKHPHTLASITNLANTLYAQGDLAGARALQEQVLAAQKALLGYDHPDTLTSMANLAETISAQGDLAGARALQNQELDVQKETLDDFHPDTLTSMKNLSNLLYKQGDLITARELQESMLEIYKTLMHPIPPKAMVCLVNIGYLSHQMNDHTYGLKYLTELTILIKPLLEDGAAEKLKALNEELTQAIADSKESMEEMYLELVQFLQHIVELLQDQHK